MQDAQPGRKFRMVSCQVVYRFGKVQSGLYFGCLVHPFDLSGFGRINEDGEVDMIGQRLEILQLAFLLLKMFLIELQSLFHRFGQFLREGIRRFLVCCARGKEVGIAYRPDKMPE